MTSDPRTRGGEPMSTLQRLARVFNAAALPLFKTRLGRRLFGGGMATVRYTGRRSGRTVELPVAYRWRGDRLVIGVVAAEQKSWWRNFTGDGAPVEVTLRDRVIAGHGIVERTDGVAVVVSATG